jgi:hypothetical protein
VIRAQMTGAADAGDALGSRLAQTLLLQGAAALLDRSQSSAHHEQERRQLTDDHSTGHAVWSNSEGTLEVK